MLNIKSGMFWMRLSDVRFLGCFFVLTFLTGISFSYADQKKIIVRYFLSEESYYVQAMEKGFLEQMVKSDLVENKNIIYQRYTGIHKSGDWDDSGELRKILEKDESSLIVTFGTAASTAVTQSMPESKCPIVFSGVTNPIDSGILKPNDVSIHITGIRYWTPPSVYLRFVKRLLPDADELCFLFDPALKPDIQYKTSLEKTELTEGLKFRFIPLGKMGSLSENDISGCRYFFGWYGLYKYQKTLSENHPDMPCIASNISQIDVGAFAAIAPNNFDIGKEAALMAVEILLNQKPPSEIPVTESTVFKIGINLKRAKELNITIPDQVVSMADKVIR